MMATISYPGFISWWMDLAAYSSPEYVMNHAMMRRILKAEQVLSQAAYRFVVARVDDNYLDHFIPPYQTHIGETVAGTIYNVREKIREGRLRGRVYEAISLWRHEQLCGGLIYSVREDCLSVAYRFFPHRLPLKLPISCSYVAEHQLIARAQELGKMRIAHGKDRNVYGREVAIGLAMYKLSVGCWPYVAPTSDMLSVPETAFESEDDLCVFLQPQTGHKVCEGVLLCRAGAGKGMNYYAVLLQQPALKVRVLSLPPR